MKNKEYSFSIKALTFVIIAIIIYKPFHEFIPVINPNNYIYYYFSCFGLSPVC